jgi:hypothetical protein
MASSPADEERHRINQPYRYSQSALGAMNKEVRDHPRHYNRLDKAHVGDAGTSIKDLMNYNEKGHHLRAVPAERIAAYRRDPEPKRISTRAPMNGIPQDLLMLLADKEIKWNPKMMTEDGAEEWCENHPGYVVRTDQDINGDGLNEVNVYHKVTGIPVWSCGYQIRRSKRPFQQRFLNEKRRNPEMFKRLKLNAMDYLYATLGTKVDISTGKRTFDKNQDAAYQKFSRVAQAHGFIAPKPNNLPITKLFNMYVLHPVYKTLMGSPDNPIYVKVNGVSKPLHNQDGLQMMRICPLLYKELVIYPLLFEAGFTPDNSTELMIKQHLRQKETQYLIMDMVRTMIHPDTIKRSWLDAANELYKYCGWFSKEYPGSLLALDKVVNYNFKVERDTAEFLNTVTAIKNNDLTGFEARGKEANEYFMKRESANWLDDSYLKSIRGEIISEGSKKARRVPKKRYGSQQWAHQVAPDSDWGPQQIFETVVIGKDGEPINVLKDEKGNIVGADIHGDGNMHPVPPKGKPGEGLRDMEDVELPKFTDA